MPRPVDSSDLERLGGDLRHEIHTTAEDLRTYVGHIVAELRQETRDSGAKTRRRMEQFEARSIARLESSAAETRRHLDVVVGRSDLA